MPLDEQYTNDDDHMRRFLVEANASLDQNEAELVAMVVQIQPGNVVSLISTLASNPNYLRTAPAYMLDLIGTAAIVALQRACNTHAAIHLENKTDG